MKLDAVSASGLISKAATAWISETASRINPNNLAERLGLPILERRAKLDELYDEMLKISIQLLSLHNIDQEQLDIIVFNYGR